MRFSIFARAARVLVAGDLLDPVAAAADAEVRSPDGAIRVQLRTDGDGRPEYAVWRKGRLVVNWSRLGFILADAPKLERNFQIENVAQRSFDDTWEQPWGERRYVRNHGNEMRVALREKYGHQLNLVFKVFDDGVGFRYEFPDQPLLRQVNVEEELTEA